MEKVNAKKFVQSSIFRDQSNQPVKTEISLFTSLFNLVICKQCLHVGVIRLATRKENKKTTMMKLKDRNKTSH